MACHARARRWSATWQVSVVEDDSLPIVAAETTKRVRKRSISSAVVLECAGTLYAKFIVFPGLAVDTVFLHIISASIIAPRATGSGFGRRWGRLRCRGRGRSAGGS